MSRPFALLVCLPVIWWLWRRDVQVRPQFSRTFWIPLFWMLILGSRPLSWWLGVGGSAGGDLEGNWFDRLVYLGLIFAAIYILNTRGISWRTLLQQNKALVVFYLFLLVTILWAPYPFVVFKRWFKEIGTIFIILLILTEEHPLEAFKAICARCAFVWFPLSEIFAKYFPAIGREYTRGGFATYTGVTTQKNSLGEIVTVVGLVLLGELIQSNRPRGARFYKGHHFTIGLALAMGLWLLMLSNSKTSLVCLLVGAVIVLSPKLPLLKEHPRRVLGFAVVTAVLLLAAEITFQASNIALSLLGRDSTLTQRTYIWEAVGQNPVNPVIGTGYMMYWDLHKGVELGNLEFDVKTAHNGYLETYLDGGVIGLGFLAIILLAIGVRVTREFLTGSEYGRLAFAFFVVILLYNVSESIYARRSPLWFAFLLFGLEFRGCLPLAVSREMAGDEDFWIDEPEPVGADRGLELSS